MDSVKYRYTQQTRPEKFVVDRPIMVAREDGTVGYIAAGTELTIDVPFGPLTLTTEAK